MGKEKEKERRKTWERHEIETWDISNESKMEGDNKIRPKSSNKAKEVYSHR